MSPCDKQQRIILIGNQAERADGLQHEGHEDTTIRLFVSSSYQPSARAGGCL